MDPFTAFSLIETVFQFLDCGSRFIFLARSLYQTGSDPPETYDHLVKIAKDFETILPELKDAKSANDKDLAHLAVECSKTVMRLSSILQRVTATHSVRKRDAMKAAFRLMYKKDEISSLQDQLGSFRDQINLHLLISLREHMSKSLDQQDECLRRMGVVHDQTLNVGGIAASILGRLVSKGGKHEPNEEVEVNLQTLLQHSICRKGFQRAQSIFSASLKYDDMIDRERRITTAHGSTFQWVLHANFQEQEPRRVKWSDLREWLESDQQLYWITGKAGSGKSTLMKFLCSSTANVPPLVVVEEEEGCGAPMESYRCHPYLKKWASPSLLVVASFYFWNSGKEMQMTQEGLLRTLLYQITSQCPEIIAEIDPGYWESLCLFGLQVTNWRVQVLHKMLFQAVDALSKTSKICLFVDGLDEFANNHEDLIFMVKELIQSSRQIKVCVASRPWNVFQDALGQGPSLRLEDLTFNDIKVFVESKFHADPEFEKLKWRYPSFTNQLIENIVAKASGVFLWVDLVVTSLLAGMTRGDRIQDFQRRLDELPPDLENLYEKILYSLDQRYLEHAAQYFALVEAARDPLTILQFAFADEESVESALKMACGPLDEYGIRLRIEAMSRRLNSRCKGFLEIDKGMQVIQGIHERHPSEVTVQYLHRTLRDFIKSPKAQKYLRSSMDPRSDPFIQLCITYLMSIKTRLAHLLLERGIIRCLIAAANVTQLNEAAMILLVDELKNEAKRPASWQQLYKMFGRESLYVQHRSPRLEQFISSSPSDKDFLRLAIIFEVVPYVRARATQAGFIQNAVPENPRRDPSLLLIALYCVEPNPTMVECLLDLGVEPNLKLSKSDSKTLWMFALTQVSTLYKIQNDLTPERYLEVEDKWKQTLKLMFLRGGHLAKVPDPLLTPISRRLLKEIKDEVGPIDQPNMGLTAWLGSIKLK